MTSLHDNVSHRCFTRQTQSKSSPLRRSHPIACKTELTIGKIRMTAATRSIAKLFMPPYGVTSSRPWANLLFRQDSMTSLIPQGQTVKI